MSLFRGNEQSFAQAVSKLAYCNPFLPERIELERQALGSDYVESSLDWNLHPGDEVANVNALIERTTQVVERVRQRLIDGVAAGPEELQIYEDLVLLDLYYRYDLGFQAVIDQAGDEGGRPAKVEVYDPWLRDAQRLLILPGLPAGTGLPAQHELPHLFACFFQVRRAFVHTFANIIGASGPTVRLRAAVWQSIFTHDMRRFRRTLYGRMGDLTTLIIGPSGTGKELVARAVGLSRYIPFNPATRTFNEDPAGSFHALNLSALSPTLMESELFGHRRGSFTGAIADRAGWLEVCPPLGTVFLDEIGELDGSIQVKLLRVLQTRTFQRIGDTNPKAFHGKIIAATNRDLALEIRAGRFREDFYYRLCSDVIATPSLRDQLDQSPGELGKLTLFLARRIVGEEEADTLAREVEDWVEKNLGQDYAWPGNVRELEQCVRNVLVRKAYFRARCAADAGDEDPATALARSMREGSLTADELLRRYCTLVYAKTGSYQETARRLGLDRRTVKDKVGPAA